MHLHIINEKWKLNGVKSFVQSQRHKRSGRKLGSYFISLEFKLVIITHAISSQSLTEKKAWVSNYLDNCLGLHLHLYQI